jgi:hypothetical protein
MPTETTTYVVYNVLGGSPHRREILTNAESPQKAVEELIERPFEAAANPARWGDTFIAYEVPELSEYADPHSFPPGGEVQDAVAGKEPIMVETAEKD